MPLGREDSLDRRRELAPPCSTAGRPSSKSVDALMILGDVPGNRRAPISADPEHSPESAISLRIGIGRSRVGADSVANDCECRP
jgi:hypothetical protein